MWKCTTCDLEFEAIPDDAVRLTHRNSRTNVFRFPDGSIHALRKIRSPKSESVPMPPEPPKEETEFLQSVVEVVAELPQPEINLEPKIEIEDEFSMTSMEFAFRRQRNN